MRKYQDSRPWVIANAQGKTLRFVRTDRRGFNRRVVSEFDSYREAAFIARQIGAFARRK